MCVARRRSFTSGSKAIEAARAGKGSAKGIAPASRATSLATALGAPRLTDGTGTITATYKYDVFGAIRSSSGTGSTEYRFTGQQDDAISGYTYLRARYYDPATGRFISKDPVRGLTTEVRTLHPYAYAANSPAVLTDLTGEFWPFDDWQQWVEVLLNSVAAPVYAPAEEGQPQDLQSMVEEVEKCGTGSALPGIETGTEVLSWAGIATGGGGLLRVVKGLSKADLAVIAGKTALRGNIVTKVERAWETRSAATGIKLPNRIVSFWSDGEYLGTIHEVTDEAGYVIHRDWEAVVVDGIKYMR